MQTTNLEPKDRIILALDVDNLDDALTHVVRLKHTVGVFKLGLEFFSSLLRRFLDIPPGGLKSLHDQAQRVFSKLDGQIMLDWKLKDIPNTMAKATGQLTSIRSKFLTVHASSTIDGMAAAVQNKGQTMILAVTVLTSMPEDEAFLTYGAPSKAKVLQFARDAVLAGCDGIVCSPQELMILGKRPELKNLIKVTPGVRPDWAAADDQKRVMTPGEAIEAGADYLVIGRPILKPPPGNIDSIKAATLIANEIAQALEKRK